MPLTARGRLFVAWTLAALLVAGAAPRAAGQASLAERNKALLDPDELDKALKEKEKKRDPFEYLRTQVPPHDVLPFVKANHWSTLLLEMRVNFDLFEGELRSAPDVGGRAQVRLLDMPHAMVFRRDARLVKGQETRLGLNVFLPHSMRELILEPTRLDGFRADLGAPFSLQWLEAHQMLVPVLANDPSAYNLWSKFQATLPASGVRDVNDANTEKQRYYKLVLPQDPDKPTLSPQPLTWTTISHVVWDGLLPDTLTPGAGGTQQALLDWLHWGGQLVVVASRPAAVAPLKTSFLGPYLPAGDEGPTTELGAADLEWLASEYRPPRWPSTDILDEGTKQKIAGDRDPHRYLKVDPILVEPNRTLALAGLVPAEGPGIRAYKLPDGRPYAVERRVGRGRVLVLGINPTDPALAKWKGMDTLVRRLVFRRPEEPWDFPKRAFGALGGPDLSWLRYLTRDYQARGIGPDPNRDNIPGDLALSNTPVAAWLDTASTIPPQARATLETASGITIPNSGFVLKIILAYIVALVPLNWFVCRFVVRKRELAWAVAPLLALGFAVAVERASAYDLGFDLACDEIDLIEVQGGYGRAHVGRFAALYSTGRTRFRVAYPDLPSAVALPMNMGSRAYLRGEENVFSAFSTTPEPALEGFLVQPRSLGMFRAEAMTPLRPDVIDPRTGVVDRSRGIRLVGEPGAGRVENDTALELRDAALIDVDGDRSWALGTIAPGATIDLAKFAESTGASAGPADSAVAWADPATYLDLARKANYGKPEDRGELRLVAWTTWKSGAFPGQVVEPPVDRHRGFGVVVAHLKYGLPDAGGRDYYNAGAPPATDDDDDTNP